MSCINCTRRFPGCHSNCEAYIKETAERSANKQIVFEARNKEKMADFVRAQNCMRMHHKGRIGIYAQV